MSKLLLYCTKAKPYITRGTSGKTYPSCVISDGIQKWHLNGKIVAECDFEVEEIKLLEDNNATMITNTLSEEELLKKSCLEGYELCNYLYDNLWCGQKGYAININNLHIFDKPRELYDCLIHPKIESKYYGCEHLSKAPQNMMYVELDDIKYILISIQPQWLCKILNGEKTIEIRKKVLKEMLCNV